MARHEALSKADERVSFSHNDIAAALPDRDRARGAVDLPRLVSARVRQHLQFDVGKVEGKVRGSCRDVDGDEA